MRTCKNLKCKWWQTEGDVANLLRARRTASETISYDSPVNSSHRWRNTLHIRI